MGLNHITGWRRSVKALRAAAVFCVLLACVSAGAQTSSKAIFRHGEVSGDDVYVRSGPSSNHYPVMKMDAGQRVNIVGESDEWYEILPPEGTFSYISGDYVDTADDKSGVVSGDNVRVRAGSQLPEFSKLKYVVQTQLSKGAEVTILGRDSDGFLRIKSPDGTTVWINRAFVILPGAVKGDSVGEGSAVASSEHEISHDSRSGRQPGGSVLADGSGSDGGDATVSRGGNVAASDVIQPLEVKEESLLASLPPSKEREELIELDALARVELGKPIDQRQFKPLIERYQVIAEQEEDSLARTYATTRISQLTYIAELLESVAKIRAMDEEAQLHRRAFLEGRAKIRETLPPIPEGMDVKGVLRTSSLYPPGSLPRRYRLVDTTSGDTERTIGYVEIPDGAGIDVASHLGHYVGVRASSERLQTGGVNPVPIFVVAELINLRPRASEDRTEVQE